MKHTQTDEKVRRSISLALEFMNASQALSGREIHEQFYTDLSEESFRKAFQRDRQMLEQCGFVITEAKTPQEGSWWNVDTAATFMDDVEVSPLEAGIITVAAQSLLSRSDILFSEDLRFALAKLHQAFAEELPGFSQQHLPESRTLKVLREAYLQQKALAVQYCNAEGTVSERLLELYGFFSLRNYLYLVAGEVTHDEVVSIKTYRSDRIVSVGKLYHSYQLPKDFTITAYKKLPFQIGAQQGEAVLWISKTNQELVALLRCHGYHAVQTAEDYLVQVPFSSSDDLVRWACDHDAVPLEPKDVRSAYCSLLECEVI